MAVWAFSPNSFTEYVLRTYYLPGTGCAAENQRKALSSGSPSPSGRRRDRPAGDNREEKIKPGMQWGEGGPVGCCCRCAFREALSDNNRRPLSRDRKESGRRPGSKSERGAGEGAEWPVCWRRGPRGLRERAGGELLEVAEPES